MKARVTIRRPKGSDAPRFLEAVRRSRSLHRGWVSPPKTPATYRAYVKRMVSDAHRGFLVVHKTNRKLVGVINLNHIIHGSLQSAFVGYYAFLDHAGAGLMREGLQLVLRHAFRKLRLHRLEANIQPANASSIALVRKCGFVREGFSRRYLKVAGRWRDHERWAILAEDYALRAAR